MPLFYFHLRENGTVIEDEEGMDLPDVGAAELEAVKSATEIRQRTALHHNRRPGPP